MNEKVDLRIIKTKKSIYDAILELMYEKTFEEIKVSEICTRALINRSTFYAHFDDKFDLLASLIQDYKQELKRRIEPNKDFIDLEEYYRQTIDIILSHVSSNKPFFLKMIDKNRNSIAMDIINDTLRESINEHIIEYYKGELPTEVLTSFFVGGICNVIMTWLIYPHYTKEEIYSYLETLIFTNDIFNK